MNYKRLAMCAAAVLVVAACSGESGTEATEVPTETTGGVAPGETVALDAVDYGYVNVPKSVASGTEFSLTNTSSEEAHEAVILKIVDGEERSLDELLELPEEESDSLVEFQGVLVALPGESAVSPESGEGTITVTDPGRYGIVCFVPQGADPEAMAEAMSSGAEEPPDMGDGTPHAFLGMTAEFTVEG